MVSADAVRLCLDQTQRHLLDDVRPLLIAMPHYWRSYAANVFFVIYGRCDSHWPSRISGGHVRAGFCPFCQPGLVGIDSGDHPLSAASASGKMAKGATHSDTVGRRITPPTAATERSMKLSPHAAPQYPDACHAYLSGDSLHTPAFSRRGNVHEALANWCSANCGDPH